ncbi:ATP-binding cassette domain-containing protein [Clostridiales bacterium COT073_COT-073]|nr:ATP-binding cassette domain-containing protein [Clostridiales bacterium COT073_COT-073]
MQTNYMIQTHQLSKAYKGSYVVNQIDLAVKEYEIYGFLGPNGAGKSTTMKMLLGLVQPTGGSLSIMGMPFNHQNRIPILRNVGALIESPSYYGHLTGKENMQIVRTLLNVPQKNIDEAIRIVRMEKQMQKKVRQYSLGMKQRLGIAMALAGMPRLLILDEPINGLDPAGIEEIRELICRLPGEYGMTVMISSHLLSEIEQTAAAIGIINQGEMIFQGSMQDLNSRRSPQLQIQTQNNRLAAELLWQYQPELTENGCLFPYMHNSQIGQAIGTLYENGIEVYRIQEKQRSLEEVFLELTGREVAL